MLADTFKYMDQAIWFRINRIGQLAISMVSGPSVNLLKWIYRCPAKNFDRFIRRFSFRCKALPDLFANLPLSPAKKIFENVYHTCRFQLKDVRIHYLIWEDLCMSWMKTKGVRIPRKLKWAASIAILILFLPASYFIYMEEQGNFHVITPGQAYRSAQLDRDELEYYLPKYNIKSILNLAATNSSDRHYRDEIEVCRELNIVHYDLRLSADRKPSSHKIDRLIAILKTAPRPVLIHCKAGADRTGLAAALWKVIVDREPKSRAKKQLSLRFGHMPFGPTTAMDNFFTEWQPQQVYLQQ
jgi:hypothetical protein